MTRKIQTNSALYSKYSLTAIGDSMTDYSSLYAVDGYRTWVPNLASRLRGLGALVQGRGFGILGSTLANAVARGDIITKYDVPKIGVIYGGINDISSTTHSALTGTATAGTSTTITFPSGGNTSANFGDYVGNVITINSGTGSGQTRTIIDYSGALAYVGSNPALGNFVATVNTPWTTTPDNTSVFSVANATQAALQANMQALVKIYKYNVSGINKTYESYNGCALWSQTLLPANAFKGQRYVIMNDTSTTGGAASNDSLTQNPTIIGNYSAAPKQSVWEFRNARAGESGWGRVAIAGTPAFSDGCSMIIVMTNNYFNFSSGGDNYNVATGTGTQTIYTSMRGAAIAAVAAENDANNSVVLGDLYRYQSYLIYGDGSSTYAFQGVNIKSETTQGSFDWHVYDNNLHHNPYGHDVVARCLQLVIQNQSGWIAALSA